MQTPESAEKKKICAYLDSIGAWYCKPATYGFGKSGTPDIIACVPYKNKSPYAKKAVFLAVEVKREGKKPTKLQEARMYAVHAAGGWAKWGTAEKVIGELQRSALND